MNLAGLLLNAKSDGGDELLNLTVDTVQCALLTTTRQRQLSLGVLSVQLDNQLLATRHPVVLSPASLAEVRSIRKPLPSLRGLEQLFSSADWQCSTGWGGGDLDSTISLLLCLWCMLRQLSAFNVFDAFCMPPVTLSLQEIISYAFVGADNRQAHGCCVHCCV